MLRDFDKVEQTWQSLAHLEYGYWGRRLGEALVIHPLHQGENAIPHPLHNGQKIIETSDQVIAMALAAAGGDRFRMAEVDAFRPQAQMQVAATINWVVVRSVLENNPAIRENLPLEEKKEKARVKHTGTGSVTKPSKVKVKRGEDHSGIGYITVPRDPFASMYYVQYCPQGLNPSDESSWVDGAQSDSCKNIEVKGLIPGQVYHFRVRTFGGGQYSLWSEIVTIRIL